MSDVEVSHVGRPWWLACCAGCLLMLISAGIALLLTLHAISIPDPVRAKAQQTSQVLTGWLKSAKIRN